MGLITGFGCITIFSHSGRWIGAPYKREWIKLKAWTCTGLGECTTWLQPTHFAQKFKARKYARDQWVNRLRAVLDTIRKMLDDLEQRRDLY